tara:strand:- start:11 stop:250 length:240 start_codon:yes stop_codon:yes gene_type:complete
MPLTRQESIGLGIGVLNIWDEYVNAHSLRQLNLIMDQYIDDRVVAYIRKDYDNTIGIRVVKLEEFRDLGKTSNIVRNNA